MKEHHHAAHDKKVQTHRSKVPVMHIVKVFFLYLTAFAAVAGWIDYSSDAVFNPLWIALITIAITAFATMIHWNTGLRNRIDDIADGDL